jgi:UDP-N-acetylglucosamine diphosphorylase / glucose-1-phosphate thymidylyltransferase / UDP-N-acetylgalactosamine diphosphorylase / glucosamine-1-phosphate N-acetyltransferase / galactosamine-1-phosphate N-acetyltransferase
MKAVILAGGRGKRLNDLTVDKNKCMIKILGKNIIEYSLDCAANTDIDKIILVVGHRAEDIINTFGNYYKGKKVEYVIQWEQKGMVHAIECCRNAIDGDDFMLLLGDEILINPRHRDMLEKFKNEDCISICGILWVDNKDLIKKTYALIQDDENYVSRLIEKPQYPFNNYMGTGDCVFKNEILKYIDLTPLHQERKEKEFPSLMQCAIDDGKKIKTFLICDRYINVNTDEDITMAEQFLRESHHAS